MTIALVDDHTILTELTKTALNNLHLGHEIIVYNKPIDFLKRFDVDNVNLLITDIMMPEITGLELIKEIRKLKSKNDLHILVLSSLIDIVTVKAAISLGANGYLAKNCSLADIILAIEMVFKYPLKPYICKSIKDSFLIATFEHEEIKLSPREKNLLLHLCEGKTPKEIAGIENLSQNTIQSYMKQLMRKMNVNRTPDLILKAIKIGFYTMKY